MKIYEFTNIKLVQDSDDPCKFHAYHKDGTSVHWVIEMQKAMNEAKEHDKV